MDVTRLQNAASRRSIATLTALVLAPLLALLFAGNALSQPGEPMSAPSATTSAAPPPDPIEYCTQRFLEPLASISASSVVAAGQGFQAELEATLANVRKTFPGRIETLLATIADPVDAGMGYQFDTSLSALRLGVESRVVASRAHYFRDRAFLPWDDRAAPADKRKRFGALSLYDAGPHAVSRQRREPPGALGTAPRR